MAAPGGDGAAADAAVRLRLLSRSSALAWSAAQSAYAAALSAAALPAPLAARLSGGTALVRVSAHRKHGDFQQLALHVRCAAGGAGADLRFDYYSAFNSWGGRAFRCSACWRALPAPPDGPRASLGWRLLAGAHTIDPPQTGLPAIDQHMQDAAELCLYDVAGLARAGELGALRSAIMGADEPCNERAALSDLTLLTLALTACGALGLDDGDCNLDAGHVWHPDEEDLSAVPSAQPTSWLQHAARAACGAPAPWDARYVPYDATAVKEDWGEGVLMAWDRHGDGNPWERDDEDEEDDGRTVRAVDGTAVRVEQLWDYVEAHGCLPFDDGRCSPFTQVSTMMMTLPPCATPEAAQQQLRELHARHCARCMEERARERARWAPARDGKLRLLP
jgi:hypothetical protein